MMRHTCSRSAVQAPYTLTSLQRQAARRLPVRRQLHSCCNIRGAEQGTQQGWGRPPAGLRHLRWAMHGPAPTHLSDENFEASSISRSSAAYMPSLHGWSGPNCGGKGVR